MGSMQRGAIVAQNENGSLEKLDGSKSYVGTATLPSGKVVTKRFRGSYDEEKKTIQRWLEWQGKNSTEKEKHMATTTKSTATIIKTTANCPFSGKTCGSLCPLFVEEGDSCSIKLGALGVFGLAKSYKHVDLSEPLELVAMALCELKPKMVEAPIEVEAAPTEVDGVNAFLEGKSFLSFVNLSGKAVNGMYSKFCKENGYPKMGEKEVLVEVDKRFPELKRKGVRGGSVFEAA